MRELKHLAWDLAGAELAVVVFSMAVTARVLDALAKWIAEP